MPQAERSLMRAVLFVAGLGVFLAQLDGTVMNVALPTLSRAFHTGSLSTVQPVITAYLVANVALLPLLGTLADRLGRKLLFLSGFVVFGAASLCCALAGSLGLLIALRIVQAIGGALLSGTSLALVAANAGQTRGQSFGRLAVVFALAGLLGPPIGGGLVQVFGWQSVFWINLPLSLVGLALGMRLLPADTPRGAMRRLDLPGAALFAGGTALLVGGASAGQESRVSWLLLVVLGFLAYGALLAWEREAPERNTDTLLNLPLLRTPAYGLGLLVAFLGNGVTIALFVLVPFWLSKGWHSNPGAIGLIFLPVALGLGGVAPRAGKLSDRIGARRLTTGGMIVVAGAAALLVWQADNLIWPVLTLAMFGLGAGSGLFAAPNNNAVLGSASEQQLAVAGSMLSAARTLGVILGVSISGALFDALRATHGINAAARVLFLAAFTLYMLNAAICWITRDNTQSTARATMQTPNGEQPTPGQTAASGHLRGAR